MNERTLSALRAGLLVSIGVLMAMVAGQIRDRFFQSDLERVQDAMVRVAELVDQRYAYPIEPREVAEHAISGMLAGLDQHSHYYPAEDTARVDRETSGTYHGIGAVFSPWGDQREFLFALPDSPAERGGIRPGDTIVTFDGQPVADIERETRYARLSNDRGEEVVLELVGRTGERRTVALVPDGVGDPSVRHVQIVDAEVGIGYLAVTTFTRRTPSEFDAAVATLVAAGAKKLIVDLRQNPGGVLRSSVRLANRFVGSGAVVVAQSRTRREEWNAEAGEDWYAGMPLVLLVDRDSASASEVLAGALQDHRAAVLLGEQTFGKGCVQTLTPLESLGIGGIVKLTTSVYRTPSGRLIDRRYRDEGAGLAPDVVVVLDDQARRTATEFLRTYSPPLQQRATLAAWQAEDPTKSILPELPLDAQVTAALEILRGQAPRPYVF